MKQNDFPFSNDELIKIFKIIDVALSDEKLESEISKWMRIIYDEEISSEEFEDLHKKINFFMQDKLCVVLKNRENLWIK